VKKKTTKTTEIRKKLMRHLRTIEGWFGPRKDGHCPAKLLGSEDSRRVHRVAVDAIDLANRLDRKWRSHAR